MIRRVLVPAALAALMVLGTAVGAVAAPRQSTIEATKAFACEGLPAAHCMNVKSNGNTGLILVFDPRGPNEGMSMDPKSDSRPCPHDPAADADGTWWEALPGLWVCHRKP